MYYVDKIKTHIINWINYILEHLVRIVFITLLLFTACFIFVSFSDKVSIYEGDVLIGQHILFFGITIENWSVFLAIIGVVCTAIWALYQFDKKTIRTKQEKASEIAQSFADNLVERISLISEVLLKNQEMQQLLSKISKTTLKSFTVMEINEITNDPKCFEKCNNIIHSKRTQQRYTDFLNKTYNKEERKKFDSYFPLLVENTLNRLEAICINISSQAAGSEFIYNSLHQSFLQFVEVLSIKISTNNRNNVDKYFTNIIQVYNMWSKQKNKDIQKYKKTQRKVNKLNERMAKEIRNLLEKKNKTV